MTDKTVVDVPPAGTSVQVSGSVGCATTGGGATAAGGAMASGHVTAADCVTAEKPRVNLVLEGGGVLGVGLVGAVSKLEEHFKFERMLGTSAGAIVAALLGADYKAREIKSIMEGPDMARLTDAQSIPLLPRVPLMTSMINVMWRLYGTMRYFGWYEGDYLYQLMQRLLDSKGVTTFADLRTEDGISSKLDMTDRRALFDRYKVHLIACDITRGRMLLLPDDMNREEYGVTPDELEVALAVRMSTSIPFFFRPIVLEGRNGVKTHIVDGGLVSNFPIQLLNRPLRKENKAVSTVGLRLIQIRPFAIRTPISAIAGIFKTAIMANDTRSVEDMEARGAGTVHILNINTQGISPIKFDISALDKESLFTAGHSMADRLMKYLSQIPSSPETEHKEPFHVVHTTNF